MTKLTKIFKNYLTNKGFTIVELLIYMGILAIFMSVLAGLFGTIIDLQLEANANTGLDRNAQFLFSRLTYDLHRASSVNTPVSTGSPGSVLILTIDGINHTYSLDGNGNLNLQNNLGTFTLNDYDTSVSNLIFTKIGNVGGVEDTINVGFTLTSTTLQRKGNETRNFQTTIGIRR